MSIAYHSAVLFTDNIESMKAFYSGVLGQAVAHDLGGCVVLGCGVTLWELKDEYPLAKALGSGCRTNTNGRMELCFETEEFGIDAERIKKSGVRLIHDIQEEQWGQFTIRFYDPEGNIIELGESMPAFVKRMSRGGMSIAGVAQKTGISINQVKEYLG